MLLLTDAIVVADEAVTLTVLPDALVSVSVEPSIDFTVPVATTKSVFAPGHRRPCRDRRRVCPRSSLSNRCR